MQEWQRHIDAWQLAIATQLLSDRPDLPAAELDAQTRSLTTQWLAAALCPGLYPDLSSELSPGLSSGRSPQREADWGLHPALAAIAATHPFAGLQEQAIAMPSADLLGHAYEACLGRSVQRSADGSLAIALQPQSPKASGSYYTPAAVVDYVIQQTVAVALEQALEQAQEKAHEQAQEQAKLGDRPPTVRILDPACGGGAFLLRAYRYLLGWHLDWYRRQPEQWLGDALQRGADGTWRLSLDERQRILQTCIFGVDIDPQAVEVTRLSLGLAMLADDISGDVPASRPPCPDLRSTIHCGNALIDAPDGECGFAWGMAFAEMGRSPHVSPESSPHVSPESSSHFSPQFDVVLGNPPYLDSETMTRLYPHWRRYCTQHYQTATGNWDIFCVFIEKALTLCRPGGWVSLVVPNKLLSAPYAAQVRSHLLQAAHLHAIRDYGRVPVFAASVYPLVFVAQTRAAAPPAACSSHAPPDSQPKPQHEPQHKPQPLLRYEQMADLTTPARTRQIHPDQLITTPHAPWLLSAPIALQQLIARLQTSLPPLSAVATVVGAATVSEAYRLRSLIHNQPAPQPTDLKLVNSGTIDRYQLRWGQKRLRYLGAAYSHPVISPECLAELPTKRQHQARQPKIIVAGLSQQLECALDASGTVLAGKSTTIIYAANSAANSANSVDHSALDLRYLLGLLNSRLINCIVTSWGQGNSLQGGYLRFGPPQLQAIPIYCPDVNDRGDRHCLATIIECVEQRLALATLNHASTPAITAQICTLEAEIDQHVEQLYGLSAADWQHLQA